MWSEIEIAKKENRRELVLNGALINERIKENGLDKHIFDLTNLNYLSLSDTCITTIDSNISMLINLQTLILHRNKFVEMDESILKLSKLKVVDLSCNSITKVPSDFDALSELVSLNLSNNKIINFPGISKNTKLALLDLSNNKLEKFPEICNANLTNLSELKLQYNNIDGIPNNINLLSALKLLDISNNKVSIIPGELADCNKLKDLNLSANPMVDRRLFKLIEQCKTKQIVDYIRLHCAKTAENIGGDNNSTNNKGKKKSKKGKNSNSQSDDENLDIEYKYEIKILKASENFKVIKDVSATDNIRPHIICCIVKNVSFSEQQYKDFIKLQNKLHDGICNKRNAATIATHDFGKIGPAVIHYTALPPKDFKIRPLNNNSEYTGAELFAKLQNEANLLRKEKKRSSYSGIHKYLYLLEGKPKYPCLLKDSKTVISFPPITNSDITKIERTTVRIFIEITSSESQLICKNVMKELIREMVNLFDKNLEIQQVQITDHEDKLKLLFPLKSDLKFDDIFAIKVITE